MTRHVPRIYCARPLQTGERLRLEEDTAHHLLHVLRLRQDDPLILFDGRGGEFLATVAALGKNWLDAIVGLHSETHRESRLSIVLGQGISRSERMDYTIQKAVELGVTSIQPLETERSVVRLSGERQIRRLEHWNEVARSAAEQCGRDRVPAVSASLRVGEWLPVVTQAPLRLLLDPEAGRGLQGLTPVTEVCLLVGPEGGLSEAELEEARAAGFIGIRLGPRILRTETAGVTALSALQALWGDLAN